MVETTSKSDCDKNEVVKEKIVDETTEFEDLNFPWPLIRLIKSYKDNYPTDFNIFRYFFFSYNFHLSIILIFSLVCFVSGCLIIQNCFDIAVLGIVFIVQGIIGLLAVFVHLIVMIYPSTSSTLIKHTSLNEARVYRNLIILSHLITAVGILCFLFGHIWIIRELIGVYTWQYDGGNLHIFTIIMFIIENLIAIWLLFVCIKKNLENKKNHFKNIEDQSTKLDEDLLTDV
ncbi:unnamed protein product [Adineta ricciae]|uniref:Uncharacterized protein n=1 Tax=Adineta ricciae TaxID=249248 RepID=A0A815TR72_ADIRI|nr:unnamed protein product [Adineta ricciae]